jgi:hypothetical protein
MIVGTSAFGISPFPLSGVRRRGLDSGLSQFHPPHVHRFLFSCIALITLSRCPKAHTCEPERRTSRRSLAIRVRRFTSRVQSANDCHRLRITFCMSAREFGDNGFAFWVVAFRASCGGVRVQPRSGFTAHGLSLTVCGFRVEGFGFRVGYSGLWVWGWA